MICNWFLCFGISAFYFHCMCVCLLHLFHCFLSVLIHASFITDSKYFSKNFGGFLQYSKKPLFHNLKIDWYISNLIFLDLFLFPFLTRCLIILALFCWFLISSLFLIILARISKCFDSRSD